MSRRKDVKHVQKNHFVFQMGVDHLPACGFKTLLLFKLNENTFVRRFFVQKILKRRLGLHNSVSFNNKFRTTSNNLRVGKNVGLADTLILSYAPVFIGDNCSFSYRNVLITSTHDFSDFSKVIVKPITIGNNVWITTNVTVLPGVTIGDNTVIGAGSVVTSDIPSGVFAAGNPCKVIKEIDFKK